jgi:hypothetical protein
MINSPNFQVFMQLDENGNETISLPCAETLKTRTLDFFPFLSFLAFFPLSPNWSFFVYRFDYARMKDDSTLFVDHMLYIVCSDSVIDNKQVAELYPPSSLLEYVASALVFLHFLEHCLALAFCQTFEPDPSSFPQIHHFTVGQDCFPIGSAKETLHHFLFFT